MAADLVGTQTLRKMFIIGFLIKLADLVLQVQGTRKFQKISNRPIIGGMIHLDWEHLVTLEKGSSMRWTTGLIALDLILTFGRGSLNLFGAFIHARELRNSLQQFSFNAYFVEADYVLLPWIIGVIRFETINRPGREIRRIVPAIVLAYRANVRLVNESELYLNDNGDSLFRIRLDFLF